MSDFNTISAITENLRHVLMREGLQFSVRAVDDGNNPAASLLPAGRIFYDGESFEYTHGQRPGYIDAEFRVRLMMRSANRDDAVRDAHRWTHKMRGALSVDALNSGSIATDKPISRVTVTSAKNEARADMFTLTLGVRIRYREA